MSGSHCCVSVRRCIAALILVASGCAALACGVENDPETAKSESAEADTRPEVEADASPEESFDIGPLGDHLANVYRGELSSVLDRRILRVLTSRNSFDYFIHGGRHGGYQYEMVKAFTEKLNKKYGDGRRSLPIRFELLPVHSDLLIPMLLEGKGDLIAARMTVTEQRAEQVLFTIPYRQVDEQVVANADVTGLEGIRELRDLSGRRVAVRRSSSYYQSLVEVNSLLSAESAAPIEIETVDEGLATEDLLVFVAEGHFPFTVADSIVASTAVSLRPELRILPDLALRKDGRLAWAVHPESVELLKELNAFLPRYREGSLLGNLAAKRYFEDAGQLRLRTGGEEKGELSPYDDLLKIHSNTYGFKWHLMAAVAYQESEFDQSARNRSGAVGLFQVKPQTAREPYIDIPEIAGEENAGNNIHAGIKYLAWIKKRYFDSIEEMDEAERIRMSLAAYNAGPRTLINARHRAQKMGLDPNIWFQNVEMALLEARKTEPVKYVSDVNRYYLSYVLLRIE